METALRVAAGVLGAVVVALIVVEVVHRIVRRLGRRSMLLGELARQAHRPFQVLAVIFAVQLALRIMSGSYAGRAVILHLLVLAVIAAAAWLVAALLLVLEDVALAKFRTDVADNLRARRLHTQVVMLRRLTVAAIVVVAVGVALMTFPTVRAIGASVLASAGLIGIVAALAAQSLLGNVIAGLQLAFSDAVKLEDVVVVEGEWGRVEEITLSHVVLHLWDDRRLILPTSYFTTTPFQNWTRSQSAVLGTVELDIDWSVPVAEMRDHLRSLVEATDLWDGRECVLQVTEATGGLVRVRALVSAPDAPTLWDLRCLVREELVAWVHEQRPSALPRQRAEVAGLSVGAEATATADWRWTGRLRTPAPDGGPPDDGPRDSGPPAAGEPDDGEPDDDARVFGGSAAGEARGQRFAGPDDQERVEPDDRTPAH